MQSTVLTSLLLLLNLLPRLSALQTPRILEPFHPAYLIFEEIPFATSNATITQRPTAQDLAKRQSCPKNYGVCSAVNANACCSSGQFCTTDQSSHVACCQSGASCTGTISASFTASSGAIMTTSTTSTGTASYVFNTFFPFPFVSSTFANRDACTGAYSACQVNYAACTQDLVSSASFGVTIVAPGGAGITVAPTVQSLGTSSATSICSSLSSEACHNLQSSNCATFGTSSGFVVGNVAAKPTADCYAGANMVALGLGIAGQMI